MFGNTKILDVNEINLDKDIYPRVDTFWVTVYAYADSMKTGSKFPPVVVTELDNKFVLVDGWHRFEAQAKLLKRKHIEAEIIKCRDKNEAFIEAIQRNAYHGRQFSAYEKAKLIIKLEELKIPQEKISTILGITEKSMIKLKMNRLVYADIKTAVSKGKLLKEERKPFILKKILYKSNINEKKIPKDLENIQSIFQAHTPNTLLDEIIVMLERKWFDKNNPNTIIKLKKIYKLLSLRLRELRL